MRLLLDIKYFRCFLAQDTLNTDDSIVDVTEAPSLNVDWTDFLFGLQ